MTHVKIPESRRRRTMRLVPAILLALSLSVPAVASAEAAFRKTLHGWFLSCQRDAMTDMVRCLAFSHHLSVQVYGPDKTPVVTVGSKDPGYPGEPCFVRIDTAPARRADACVWSGAEASAIITALLRGQQVRTRFVDWPSGLNEDSQFSLAGFPAVWAALQAAYAAQHGGSYSAR
jgi:hypothetical protein